MRFVIDRIPKYTDDGENLPAYNVTKSQLFCYIHYSYHSNSLYWSFAWIYVNYFGTCFICNHLKPLSFDNIYHIEQYNDGWFLLEDDRVTVYELCLFCFVYVACVTGLLMSPVLCFATIICTVSLMLFIDQLKTHTPMKQELPLRNRNGMSGDFN